MFQITKNPSSGSDDLYFEITCNGSQIFITCVVGIWRHILNLWCVCVCVVSQSTHTSQVQNIPPNTDHAHEKYLCTITSNFKVQVITPMMDSL